MSVSAAQGEVPAAQLCPGMWGRGREDGQGCEHHLTEKSVDSAAGESRSLGEVKPPERCCLDSCTIAGEKICIERWDAVSLCRQTAVSLWSLLPNGIWWPAKVLEVSDG